MENYGLEYRETSDGELVVTGKGAFWGGEVVIPETVSGKAVVGIDKGAFKKDRGLRTVVVPEGVRRIDAEAFSDCTSLEKIFLPSTLREIGAGAFARTDSEGERGLDIKEVHIADIASWCRVRFLGDDSSPLLGGGDLYIDGYYVSELYIPDGVRCVSKRAFMGCGSIEALYVPDSVERIMDDAFALCLGLNLVSLGRGLKTIEDDAFLGCFFITDIINLSGIEIKSGTYAGGRIGLNAEKIADRETIAILPFSVEGGFEFVNEDGKVILTGYHGDGGPVMLPQSDDIGPYEVGDRAFFDCDSLTEVVIPPSVTRVGEKAFSRCFLLCTATVGSGVKEIGASAFSSCMRLYRVSLGNRLEKIGGGAFEGCKNLFEVENLSGLDIKEGSEGFGGVALHAENVYDARQGKSQITRRSAYEFFGDISDARLVGYLGRDTEDFHLPDFEFPYKVASHVFSETEHMRYLTVPWCVMKVGDYAFKGCWDLQSLIIDEGVDEIGVLSFAQCFGLASVVIPKSMKKVGEDAFMDCESLCTVYYGGGRKEFEKLEVEPGNEHLTEADIYYYSEKEPLVGGIFWHYDENGIPEIW